MKVNEALSKGKNFLDVNNIEESGIISRILLSYVLGIKREKLIIISENELDKIKEEKYFNLLEKVSIGYPVHYITGTKEFMKMEFIVTKDVLIPRQDTEILVEEAINLLKEKKDVLDMCTGSGAIGISLAKYVNDISVTMSDISKNALDIANQNAKRLLTNQNVNFIESDMFENINSKYDAITINPPYIKTKVIPKYSLNYEPNLALDGGEDGLKFYRIIINEGYKYLKENGIILLEIGFDQKKQVMDLVKESKKYKSVYCKKDLGNQDRVIVIS